jgi:hypothetical protein
LASLAAILINARGCSGVSNVTQCPWLAGCFCWLHARLWEKARENNGLKISREKQQTLAVEEGGGGGDALANWRRQRWLISLGTLLFWVPLLIDYHVHRT